MTKRERPPSGAAWLFASIIRAALFGCLLALFWYGVWSIWVESAVEGREWAWVVDPPGPWGHWPNTALWLAGFAWVASLPRWVPLWWADRRRRRGVGAFRFIQ